MGVSKVDRIQNGRVVNIIDISNDTVTANTLMSGSTAHGKNGEVIRGTVVIQKFYTGSTPPSASLGDDGDLYLMR